MDAGPAFDFGPGLDTADFGPGLDADFGPGLETADFGPGFGPAEADLGPGLLVNFGDSNFGAMGTFLSSLSDSVLVNFSGFEDLGPGFFFFIGDFLLISFSFSSSESESEFEEECFALFLRSVNIFAWDFFVFGPGFDFGTGGAGEDDLDESEASLLVSFFLSLLCSFLRCSIKAAFDKKILSQSSQHWILSPEIKIQFSALI